MPYQRLVTFYTRNERKMLHAQGIWVDRDGNQIPVRNMNGYRLEKLVRTLGRWAEKENNNLQYLSSHPIFAHVLLRIRETGLDNYYADMFLNAYYFNRQENRIWQR